MVLQGHYRAPLTYSEEGLLAADRGLDRLRAAADPNAPAGTAEPDGAPVDLVALTAETDRQFHAAMDDDFNTPVAVSTLFDLARAINRTRAEGADAKAIEPARQTLVALAGVLGLDLLAQPEAEAGDAAPFIDLLLRVRQDLRAAKQWALADTIRDDLANLGIEVEDTPAGPVWSRKTT
jgi:cysteinyl-tRNA synthetase